MFPALAGKLLTLEHQGSPTPSLLTLSVGISFLTLIYDDPTHAGEFVLR